MTFDFFSFVVISYLVLSSALYRKQIPWWHQYSPRAFYFFFQLIKRIISRSSLSGDCHLFVVRGKLPCLWHLEDFPTIRRKSFHFFLGVWHSKGSFSLFVRDPFASLDSRAVARSTIVLMQFLHLRTLYFFFLHRQISWNVSISSLVMYWITVVAKCATYQCPLLGIFLRELFCELLFG